MPDTAILILRTTSNKACKYLPYIYLPKQKRGHTDTHTHIYIYISIQTDRHTNNGISAWGIP